MADDPDPRAATAFPELSEHNVLATFRDQAAAREAVALLGRRGVTEGVFVLAGGPDGGPAELPDSAAWHLARDAIAEGRVVVGVCASESGTADVADEVLRAEGVGNIGRFDAAGAPRM